MVRIQDITAALESWAPPAYQESYDNAGLIVGDPQTPLTGVLICLDATEAVVAEAERRGCNLVVAHHPIVFKGLKKINTGSYVGRAVVGAVKHDVALYAAHTNLDNVQGGVNFHIAARLGLQGVRILAPKKQVLQKLVAFVPAANTPTVLDALYAAGPARSAITPIVRSVRRVRAPSSRVRRPTPTSARPASRKKYRRTGWR